jgi:hypothetical protein
VARIITKELVEKIVGKLKAKIVKTRIGGGYTFTS